MIDGIPAPRASRRRVLTLMAAAAALTPVLPAVGTGELRWLHEWSGAAMGTRVRLLMAHDDERKVRRAVQRVVAEIDRLENIFSLHRGESEISRLNRDSVLRGPSLDLVTLLAEAAVVGELTGGAFDTTVQPLWHLYSDHFSGRGSGTAGPSTRSIAAARSLVDFRQVEVGRGRIALAKAGMALTLNGIAQGYVTDRAADLLRGEGFDHVLVDLGEIQALGRALGAKGWPVRIAHPTIPGGALETLTLSDRAIATSSGAAARFDAAGRFHHIFDPATGGSANFCRSVSVIADRATTADALSTALSTMPPIAAAGVLARFPAAEARLLTADDRLLTLPPRA
jgi:thiamine biosynthesis lipoprotein